MSKIEEYNNVTIDEALETLKTKKTEIIEAFAKAYLAETGLKPSEVELVTQQMPVINGVIETIMFFRRKSGT